MLRRVFRLVLGEKLCSLGHIASGNAVATGRGESVRRRLALAAAMLPPLQLACAGLQPDPGRPIDRLCGADEGCRAAVARAPELTYPHLDQAVTAGLAWAHEQPQTQAPLWLELGLTVYRSGEGYRLEVAHGRSSGVDVNLRPGAVAAAHIHPLPMERRCSAVDRETAARVPIPVYLQHVRGAVERCTPLRVVAR